MPIDSRIALGVQVPQPQNPLDAYAKLAQVQGIQNQNRLADLAFAQKQREDDQTNALSGLYRDALKADGTIDRAKLFTGAANAGLGAKIPALQKTFADLDQAQALLDKNKIEAAHKKLDVMGQAFGAVRANPTLETATATLNYLGENGILTPAQVQQYTAQATADPSKIGQLADIAFRSVLDAKSQLPTYQTRNTGGSTDTLAIDPVTGKVTVASSVKNTQSPDSKASVDEQRRAHNMADARARDANKAAALSQPFQVTDATGKEVLVQQDKRTGQLVPVQGGYSPKASDKAPTEFQGKSATYGMRAQEADKIIQSLDGEYDPAAINSKLSVESVPLVGGIMGAATNKFALSANDQQAEQAQREFINAVLRQESGAVIGQSEFDNARKQYFPQPGDSAAVKAQKAQNRRTAIMGLQNNAGPAGKAAPVSTIPSGWTVQEH